MVWRQRGSLWPYAFYPYLLHRETTNKRTFCLMVVDMWITDYLRPSSNVKFNSGSTRFTMRVGRKYLRIHALTTIRQKVLLFVDYLSLSRIKCKKTYYWYLNPPTPIQLGPENKNTWFTYVIRQKPEIYRVVSLARLTTRNKNGIKVVKKLQLQLLNFSIILYLL